VFAIYTFASPEARHPETQNGPAPRPAAAVDVAVSTPGVDPVRIDLATLDAQTRFVNAKLAERAFSWSTLLDELESVLAQDVRLVSVAPQFNGDGSINLALDFEAKGPNGMIVTINRMNADPQFANPFPKTEEMTPTGGYKFNLVVKYRPPETILRASK
jgi:hypothetical protein